MEIGNKGVLIGVGTLACAAIGIGFYFMRPLAPPEAPAPAETSTPVTARREPPAIPAIPLPSLDQSDGFLREKAASVFSRPADWIKADNLLRRLTAAATIVAEGDSPRESLGFLKPRGKFSVKTLHGRIFLNPRSYERYDAMANAVGSLDAPAAAKLILHLKPLFETACAELDDQNCDFQAALIKSAQELLRAPLVTGDIQLREKIISYAMADAKLERLSAAQKHLLRMGPRNAAKIQGKLRELAIALGTPAASLPDPETIVLPAR